MNQIGARLCEWGKVLKNQMTKQLIVFFNISCLTNIVSDQISVWEMFVWPKREAKIY